MSKIPSRSNTNYLRIDLKIVGLLVNTGNNLKLYLRNALHSPGTLRHARLWDLRSLLIFSLILMLGASIGIQGMAPAHSASTPGPVENMRTGMTYQTIQAAIDDASTAVGDTIQVSSGTYHEHVNIDKSVILKGVNTGNGLPVVDGSGSGAAISLAADGVTLQGFTATDADYGIYILSNNNIVTGNTANNNNNDGILLHSSSYNSVTGNTASYNNGNASRTDSDGIFLENSNNNVVTGNTASYNNYGNGIKLDSSTNNNVSGNTANNNYNAIFNSEHTNLNYNFGIYLWGSSNNIVSGNTANNNNYGIFLNGWGNSGSNYNRVSGNTANNNIYGIWVDDSTHNTLSDNSVNNNNKNGIYLLDGSAFNDLINNTATANNIGGDQNDAGICFDHANHNTLTGNMANSNNNDGICFVDQSNDNTLKGNTANNNVQNGIELDNLINNSVSGNTANSNKNYGIFLYGSSGNNVIGNTAENNGFGIQMAGSINNVLYLNIVQGNTYKNAVVTDGSSNSWNSPTMLEYTYNGQTYTNYNGNYWGDGQWADQTNGIENSAYTIYTNNVDHYPMVLAGSPITPSPTASPTVTPTPSPSPDSSSFTLNLKSGWNLVGWCSLKSPDASTVSGLIPGSQVIARYNSTTGGYDPYVEGYSPAKDSFVMQPGAGYFIESDTAQNLNFGVF